MDGGYRLADLRFDGYDNQALAGQVDGLRNGAGSESLHNAARALVALAGGLSETGRVRSVVGVAPTLESAHTEAYQRVAQIHLAGSHHRTDVALRAVPATR
jgi:phosphoribosylamine--glycine ligase